MNVIVHKPKKDNDGKISFPNLQCWNPLTNVATIAAQVGTERVSCKIELAVLGKKYKDLDEEPMKNITEHRTELEAVARQLIENKSYEKDGSILIRLKDLKSEII